VRPRAINAHPITVFPAPDGAHSTPVSSASTDAGVEDADFESLVCLIAEDNVNLASVLGGGAAAGQSLIDMAAWGRGRFYSAPDRYNLPEIVLKQAATMDLPAYKIGSIPGGRSRRRRSVGRS